ncbi:hypothetical protein H072_6670 [Dactylellina haptotyla CBS 200.50]|uniref:Oligopeptide transporter n=1 Tax=Dactylellina haptotyla (strain CBS 200.50) TaxID=1284197 RepID=S8BW96_DACHA|nr:hypothetical protein H072_6670 [Dactylellina haptotyla CBS 200.50]
MEKNAQGQQFDNVELAAERHSIHQVDEKKNAKDYTVEVGSEKGSSEEIEVLDPYSPFPIDLSQPDEGNILTVRAIVLGCALGALVNASNLYLGLKTGWLFGANLFGALLGFAILKALSKAPLKIPGLTDHFGPMENNIVQTAAAAAGGMGLIFVSGIPALYHLGLMSPNPKDDFGKLIAITFCASLFGISFSVPLRKFFIISVARELSLIFPTATATAVSIRAMHATGDGYGQAKKKIKALGYSFAGAFLLRVISQYCIGVLWDWHIFWWIYSIAKTSNVPARGVVGAISWGWFIEFTPAFIGSGLLVGLNSAFSLFFGGVFAWAIVGPLLVKNGAAFGKTPGGTEVEGLQNYMSMTVSNLDHVSPRYWLLWPGVFAMILVSMAELAFNYKIISAGFVAGYKSAVGGINKLRNRNQPVAESDQEDDNDKDIFSAHEQVPTWMWGSMVVITTVLICVILGVMYGFPVGVSILSILFAFIFAFLAIQCTGASDTTPVSTVAKASQLATGGVTKGMHVSIKTAQTINLMAGCVAGAAASQSTDLINDFKVGYLLRTPPRKQWYAQIIGSIVAIFMAPSLFILFSTAYPCILEPGAEKCAFGAPSIAAWRAVTEAVTSPQFPVPRGSAIFSLVYGIICVLISLARHVLHVKGKDNIANWLPNTMVFSLALTLPYTQYGTAMIIGAGIAASWQKAAPESWNMYGTSIASGLIAGEGIGGVINALFEVLKISGGFYGSGFGCPDGAC